MAGDAHRIFVILGPLGRIPHRGSLGEESEELEDA